MSTEASPASPTAAAIKRLEESCPPATDTFTYLTIIEKSLSPSTLPTILGILQDQSICQDIGWDLVDKLLVIPGSVDCLQTIARLGNPREVIIKVLETLEHLEDLNDDPDDPDDSDDSTEEIFTSRFSILLGMLGILHKRLQVRSPSRFLHSSLSTIAKVYSSNPTPRATKAIIDLVYALRPGATRPPLPSRKSSTVLTQSFPLQKGGLTAPDPEADAPATNPVANGKVEEQLTNRLLKTFVTCVIEAYVNGNDMGWAARLVEYYAPERIIPGRRSWMVAFKRESELVARDAQIGQLVSLAADLGLTKLTPDHLDELCHDPLHIFPLRTEPDHEHPEAIKLSSGGLVCLMTYWIFASELFDGPYSIPDLHVFPDHSAILGRFLENDPAACINANPGTIEALMVMGLYLENNKKINTSTSKPSFMEYLHLVTLISVFHPSLLVRNAATALAGGILHADPDDGDRLKILEDLLENCVFASLQAQAVTWLREELQNSLPHAAERAALPTSPARPAANRFASTEALDTLQYALFPALESLREESDDDVLESWEQNYPMYLQAANLAMLIFGAKDAKGASPYRVLVPQSMPEAVEERYLLPLADVARRVGKLGKEREDMNCEVQADLVLDRLGRITV